jgi:hypothetical protein
MLEMNPLFHRSYRKKVSGKTSATAKAGVPWPIFAVAGNMLSRQPQDLYDLVKAQPAPIRTSRLPAKNGPTALTISCQRVHRHGQIAVEFFQVSCPAGAANVHPARISSAAVVSANVLSCCH